MAKALKGLRAEMSESGEICEVYVYQTVRYDDAWSVEWLCRKIREAIEGKATIVVHLNTDGGSVTQVYAICNALNDALIAGCQVETRIEGLAASMGAFLSQFATPGKRLVCRNSLAMVHNASEEGQETELSKKVTLQMAEHFAKTTGQKLEAVQAMLAKTTWMTAGEWQAAGFADAIVEPVLSGDVPKPTAQADTQSLINLFIPMKGKENGGTAELTDQQRIEALEARLAEKEKAEQAAPGKALEAKAEMARIMSLPNEAEQIEALQAVFNRTHALTAQLAEKDQQIAILEADRVNAMIAAARENGKITSDEEASSLRALAATSYENVRALLATRPAARKPSELIGLALMGDSRKDWTLETWQQNDPQGWLNMETSNPTRYNQLLAEYTQRNA